MFVLEVEFKLLQGTFTNHGTKLYKEPFTPQRFFWKDPLQKKHLLWGSIPPIGCHKTDRLGPVTGFGFQQNCDLLIYPTKPSWLYTHPYFTTLPPLSPTSLDRCFGTRCGSCGPFPGSKSRETRGKGPSLEESGDVGTSVLQGLTTTNGEVRRMDDKFCDVLVRHISLLNNH